MRTDPNETIGLFTIGIDYGTNSVRALVVRTSDGFEVGSCVVNYPSGEQGIPLSREDPFLARQRPGDHLFGLEHAVKGALKVAASREGFRADQIAAIGVDTTGSSPLPVDSRNRALGENPTWKDNLDAQCWLWKEHTSWREAQKITELTTALRPDYIRRCGGVYSSEWWWSKIWHCLNAAPDVFDAAYSWVESADWIPSVLTGVSDPTRIRRGVCAAGHKAFFDAEWDELPNAEFLGRLDPTLASLRERLYRTAFDASEEAGRLCPV